jgi:hypothetical protein
MNAKIGKEHEVSNENRKVIIQFAEENNIKIKSRYCYDLNRRAIVNLRDFLECSRIHRDGNVLGLPPKNLRTEGVEAINRGNQRQRKRIFHDLLPGVLSVPGESQGDSDRVNLQGRRDDVVEFTRAVGDDSSKYHRSHRQADHGLHYGRLQTERFCGSGSRRVLSVQVVPGLTGRCRIYPPASPEQW